MISRLRRFPKCSNRFATAASSFPKSCFDHDVGRCVGAATMTRALVLDFGTSSVRAGVYDIGSRTMCASAEAPYATTYPRRGWAEQDPEERWSARRIAARQVVAES